MFFISKCYLSNHGAKDELKGATPIGITLQRFTLYTLVSFSSNYSPTISIYPFLVIDDNLFTKIFNKIFLDSCCLPKHITMCKGYGQVS